MSKSLSTIAAVFAVAMPLTAGNTRAGDKAATADEQALRKLEREWVDAETRHDAVSLQSILDDKFVASFGAAKPLDKDAFIKEVTAGPVDPTVSQELSWPSTGSPQTRSFDGEIHGKAGSTSNQARESLSPSPA